MAQIFEYVATDSSGRRIAGKTEASSAEDVANSLHEQNLIVVSVSENIGLDWSQISSLQIGGVPLKEKVLFVKQLSTMLSSGLPLIQALSILVEQAENPSLQKKLQRVYQDVSSGIPLSEAFAKEETVFNNVQINLLVAGEKSGNLNEIMLKIADDMQKAKDLRSKIQGAMIYPIILMVVLAGVVAAMLVFMIPSVEQLYNDFGADELPMVTSILVSMSNFITSPAGIIIIITVIGMFVFGIRYLYANPSTRKQMDKLILSVPVFGDLIAKIQLAEFNRLISLLLTSGVSIVDALTIVSGALTNVIYRDLVRDAALQVSKGNTLSQPLAKGDVFPLMMLKMLATGEKTGKLDQVTGDMGKYYDKEVDEITSNLTKLMEPIIMVVVGGVVAFLAVAIYLPIYQLGQLAA